MTPKTEHEMLLVATEIANSQFDGHLTIGKFTTGWQVFGGTPSEREDWLAFPLSKTLKEALDSFLKNRWDIANPPSEIS